MFEESGTVRDPRQKPFNYGVPYVEAKTWRLRITTRLSLHTGQENCYGPFCFVTTYMQLYKGGFVNGVGVKKKKMIERHDLRLQMKGRLYSRTYMHHGHQSLKAFLKDGCEH
ncbi:hypothetical protein POM88_042100 [Heracleum sosnowskyi]|uniref:Uncharacterized protein n=1 Tax=Heracleum sosnowskyi TaxID=360622 RepID=A0AAD8HHL7_9APIA|nr:hypothetical protein POM88_042100 [Heracleum sosnowskyi]